MMCAFYLKTIYIYTLLPPSSTFNYPPCFCDSICSINADAVAIVCSTSLGRSGCPLHRGIECSQQRQHRQFLPRECRTLLSGRIRNCDRKTRSMTILGRRRRRVHLARSRSWHPRFCSEYRSWSAQRILELRYRCKQCLISHHCHLKMFCLGRRTNYRFLLYRWTETYSQKMAIVLYRLEGLQLPNIWLSHTV